MLNPVEFYSRMLDEGISASGEFITLRRGEALALDAVGKGNHCYLVLDCGGRTEVVRYTHTDNYADRKKPDVLVVERDITGTGRKSFPPGTCVANRWFGLAITEWITQGAKNA